VKSYKKRISPEEKNPTSVPLCMTITLGIMQITSIKFSMLQRFL